MHAQLDKYSVHSAEAVKQRKLMRQQALLPELSYVLQESQVALAAEHHSRTSSGHKSLKSSESWTGDEQDDEIVFRYDDSWRKFNKTPTPNDPQPLAIEPLTETAREELVFEELLREYSDMVDKQLESTFSKMQDFVPHPAPIFPEVISMEALDALLERLERNATDEPQTHLEAESDTLESERMKHHESESVTESVAESVSSTKSKKPKKKTTKKKRSKPIQKPVTATGRFMIYSSQEHEDNFTTILYKIIDSYGYNLLHLHKRSHQDLVFYVESTPRSTSLMHPQSGHVKREFFELGCSIKQIEEIPEMQLPDYAPVHAGQVDDQVMVVLAPLKKGLDLLQASRKRATLKAAVYLRELNTFYANLMASSVIGSMAWETEMQDLLHRKNWLALGFQVTDSTFTQTVETERCYYSTHSPSVARQYQALFDQL